MSMINVARHAGVSTSTVSHIVNGHACVSPETERRVRDAIAALKYVPPAPARRRGPRPKRRQKTSSACLALVIGQVTQAQLHGPIYVAVMGSIEAAARARGYSLLLHRAALGAETGLETLIEQAAGLILFGFDSSTIPDMLRTVPCVKVMGPEEEPEAWYDRVSYKDALTGSIAAEHLASRGHKHCVAIGDGRSNGRASLFGMALKRFGGTTSQFSNNGLVDDSSEYRTVNHAAFRLVVDRIMDLSPRPTGLFLDSDMLAAFIYPALLERGVRIGVDMDIVSVNNEVPLIGNLYPRPASIDIHAAEIGEIAVDRLIWRLTHPGAAQVDIRLTPTLRPGSER